MGFTGLGFWIWGSGVQTSWGVGRIDHAAYSTHLKQSRAKYISGKTSCKARSRLKTMLQKRQAGKDKHTHTHTHTQAQHSSTPNKPNAEGNLVAEFIISTERCTLSLLQGIILSQKV